MMSSNTSISDRFVRWVKGSATLVAAAIVWVAIATSRVGERPALAEPPAALVGEACCLPDGVCLVLLPAECNLLGGVSQGNGVPCLGDEDGDGLDDTCPASACCLEGGLCVDVSPGDCLAIGGKLAGFGTVCMGDVDGNGFDDACETQACCLPGGACMDLTPADCNVVGGKPQGVFSVCFGDIDGNGFDDACEPRACCLPGGFCLDLSPEDCNLAGGKPSPLGTMCLGDDNADGIDDACQPRGCCMPGGFCLDLTPQDCNLNEGKPTEGGALCLGDEDGDGIDEACKIEMAVFDDPGAFEAFNVADGKVMKGLEDFEPPVTDVPAGTIATIGNPLEGNVPNVDPGTGFGFPGGLANKNIVIQSNSVTFDAPAPAPGIGMNVVGPGFFPSGPNSVKVGPMIAIESLDLIFDPAENHTGVGFTLEIPFPVTVNVFVAVFDESDTPLLSRAVPVSGDGGKVFFGVWSQREIGRINVGGLGPKLIDDIQMWLDAPPCPWDCGNGDGVVSTADLLALLAGWGGPGPCDFDGSGGVGTADLLKLLASWGACP